jgi:hypothetical protein
MVTEIKDIPAAIEALRKERNCKGRNVLDLDTYGKSWVDGHKIGFNTAVDQAFPIIEAQQTEIERLSEGWSALLAANEKLNVIANELRAELRARTCDKAEYGKPDKEKRFHAEILAAHPMQMDDH